MSNHLQLPKTDTPPDNTYFDSNVISWNFETDGNKATLGFILPGFTDEFPVSDGGELITLIKPVTGATLSIDVLTEAGDVEKSHVLREDGEEVFIPGGKMMSVSTANKIVEYVCVYPGQPADQ